MNIGDEAFDGGKDIGLVSKWNYPKIMSEIIKKDHIVFITRVTEDW